MAAASAALLRQPLERVYVVAPGVQQVLAHCCHGSGGAMGGDSSWGSAWDVALAAHPEEDALLGGSAAWRAATPTQSAAADAAAARALSSVLELLFATHRGELVIVDAYLTSAVPASTAAALAAAAAAYGVPLQRAAAPALMTPSFSLPVASLADAALRTVAALRASPCRGVLLLAPSPLHTAAVLAAVALLNVEAAAATRPTAAAVAGARGAARATTPPAVLAAMFDVVAPPRHAARVEPPLPPQPAAAGGSPLAPLHAVRRALAAVTAGASRRPTTPAPLAAAGVEASALDARYDSTAAATLQWPRQPRGYAVDWLADDDTVAWACDGGAAATAATLFGSSGAVGTSDDDDGYRGSVAWRVTLHAVRAVAAVWATCLRRVPVACRPATPCASTHPAWHPLLPVAPCCLPAAAVAVPTAACLPHLPPAAADAPPDAAVDALVVTPPPALHLLWLSLSCVPRAQHRAAADGGGEVAAPYITVACEPPAGDARPRVPVYCSPGGAAGAALLRGGSGPLVLPVNALVAGETVVTLWDGSRGGGVGCRLATASFHTATVAAAVSTLRAGAAHASRTLLHLRRDDADVARTDTRFHPATHITVVVAHPAAPALAARFPATPLVAAQLKADAAPPRDVDASAVDAAAEATADERAAAAARGVVVLVCPNPACGAPIVVPPAVVVAAAVATRAARASGVSHLDVAAQRDIDAQTGRAMFGSGSSGSSGGGGCGGEDDAAATPPAAPRRGSVVARGVRRLASALHATRSLLASPPHLPRAAPSSAASAAPRAVAPAMPPLPIGPTQRLARAAAECAAPLPPPYAWRSLRCSSCGSTTAVPPLAAVAGGLLRVADADGTCSATAAVRPAALPRCRALDVTAAVAPQDAYLDGPPGVAWRLAAARARLDATMELASSAACFFGASLEVLASGHWARWLEGDDSDDIHGDAVRCWRRSRDAAVAQGRAHAPLTPATWSERLRIAGSAGLPHTFAMKLEVAQHYILTAALAPAAAAAATAAAAAAATGVGAPPAAAASLVAPGKTLVVMDADVCAAHMRLVPGASVGTPYGPAVVVGVLLTVCRNLATADTAAVVTAASGSGSTAGTRDAWALCSVSRVAVRLPWGAAVLRPDAVCLHDRGAPPSQPPTPCVVASVDAQPTRVLHQLRYTDVRYHAFAARLFLAATGHGPRGSPSFSYRLAGTNPLVQYRSLLTAARACGDDGSGDDDSDGDGAGDSDDATADAVTLPVGRAVGTLTYRRWLLSRRFLCDVEPVDPTQRAGARGHYLPPPAVFVPLAVAAALARGTPPPPGAGVIDDEPPLEWLPGLEPWVGVPVDSALARAVPLAFADARAAAAAAADDDDDDTAPPAAAYIVGRQPVHTASGPCAICLDAIDGGHLVTLRPSCGHRYHERCWRGWDLLDTSGGASSSRCPSCVAARRG